jgi:hypothetical protein
MNEDGNTRGKRRYIALDIHEHYCVVAGEDREAGVLLQPVRVEHAGLEGWLKKNLLSTDQVVIESSTNAWHLYDLLNPLPERVVVANPTYSNANPGSGLEGCPYPRNNKQKTARSRKYPYRFSVLLFFLTYVLLTP